MARLLYFETNTANSAAAATIAKHEVTCMHEQLPANTGHFSRDPPLWFVGFEKMTCVISVPMLMYQSTTRPASNGMSSSLRHVISTTQPDETRPDRT